MNTATPDPATRPRPRWNLRPALVIALMIGAGAGFGYLLGKSGIQLPWVRERLEVLTGWDLLVLPVLVLVVLGVHELGHLLGGFSRGMRFLLLIFGPFQWSRSAEGIQFRWQFNLGTFGGLAAATPDPDRPLAPQLLRLIAGGPLASLVLALAGIGGAALLDGRAAAYALIVGGLSLLICIVTTVPTRAGGFMSDGMQWLEVRRGGAGVIERHVLLNLMGQSMAGTRPRDWDAGLMQQALELPAADPLRRVAARQLALYQALDRGDAAGAAAHGEWLAAHLDDYPAGFRQGITLELCLLAAQRGDVAAAREWWGRSRGGVTDAARRALAEAALASLEGDTARCARALAAGRRALPRGMDAGVARLTADQLAALAA